MSLLPSCKTFSSPGNPLYATQSELNQVISTLNTVNVSSINGSGITVTEPSPNLFNVGLSLSNAGGIGLLTYPGFKTVGLSNAGVTSLTASTGIIGSNTTGAVTVTNSISANTNLVQDLYDSSPLTATTPGGGAITTLVTYGQLIPGKIYLFVLNCGITTSTDDVTKNASIVITFAGIGEQYEVMTIPNNTGRNYQNACVCIQIPAGKTSCTVSISGSAGYTTETATGTINNACIIMMN